MTLQDKVLVIPDAQVPQHNKDSLKVILNFAKFYKPTKVIYLGDFANLDSLSRYDRLSPSESNVLTEEIEQVNAVLDDVDRATKNAQKVFILGNHEKRYEIYKLNNWCKEVRHQKDMTTIQDEFNFKKRGYECIEYGGVYPLGHALFTHGWFANQYHAAKTLKRFFKNIYYGHAHSWQVFSMLGLDGQPVEAVSCGCICETDIAYLKGKPVDWVQMFCYGEFMRDKTYFMHFSKIINGKTYEFGREF